MNEATTTKETMMKNYRYEILDGFEIVIATAQTREDAEYAMSNLKENLIE
jgi:hypothetical protein